MADAILITPHGVSWAVKHNGGFLGYAKSREEAVLIGQDLVEWLASKGRAAALVVEEPRSFRAADGAVSTPSSSFH
jgi:hypothetical protein